MRICGISDPSQHYFVDDSILNAKGAKAVGWRMWLFDEDGTTNVEDSGLDGSIRSLEGTLAVPRISSYLAKFDFVSHQNFDESGNPFSFHNAFTS